METHEMPPDPARLSSAPFALDIYPELPAVQPALRLHFVDGLRGLAMLSVLLYHCWQNGGEWGWTPFGPHSVNLAAPLGFGYVGVNLFLVLSGFCLYWPLTRPDRPEPTLWAFAQKRCRRILPPYYAALLVAAAWPAGILNRELSAPWLVKLGVFSYSVYLIHLPLTKALDALAVSHHWPVAVFGVFVIAPLILLLGYLFHLRFEKPFMNAPKSRAPSSGTPPRWV